MSPSRTGRPDAAATETAERLDWLARWLDDVFQLPGLPVRFGLDVLVGLIPGLGDTVTSSASLYILTTASRFGVSRFTILRMAANLGLDYVVGAIPLVGDIFDVYWKANRRNMALLRRHAAATPEGELKLRAADRWFVIGVCVALVGLLVASVVTSALLIAWLVSLVWAR